jgi:thioredoxin 1
MIQVMKFSADWCGPCKALKPIWDNLVKTVNGVDFVPVNVDNDPDMASRFKIQAIPTLVFVKDGTEVTRITGLVKEAEIVKIIDSLR